MRPGGGGDGTFDHGMGVRVRVVRCALGARLLEYDQSLAHLGHCRRSAPTGSCDRKKEVGESSRSPREPRGSLLCDRGSGLAIVGGAAQRALQRVL
jgi:hypothetical protein